MTLTVDCRIQQRERIQRLGCWHNFQLNIPLYINIFIYVGKEDHRFIVELHYLNHPLFVQLLDLSAAELGYSHNGALRMACDIPLFEHVLTLLSNSNPSAH